MNTPIKITTPGADVKDATGADILLGADPLMKLDIAKDISFRTYTITFNTEPANPTPATITETLLYTEAHGYNYIPKTWFMFQNPSPSYPADPTAGNSATTYQDFGDDTEGSIFFTGFADSLFVGSNVASTAYRTGAGDLFPNIARAALVLSADATNIYFKLVKQRGSNAATDPFTINANVIGVTLKVRTYVFVEEMEV